MARRRSRARRRSLASAAAAGRPPPPRLVPAAAAAGVAHQRRSRHDGRALRLRSRCRLRSRRRWPRGHVLVELTLARRDRGGALSVQRFDAARVVRRAQRSSPARFVERRPAVPARSRAPTRGLRTRLFDAGARTRRRRRLRSRCTSRRRRGTRPGPRRYLAASAASRPSCRAWRRYALCISRASTRRQLFAASRRLAAATRGGAPSSRRFAPCVLGLRAAPRLTGPQKRRLAIDPETLVPTDRSSRSRATSSRSRTRSRGRSAAAPPPFVALDACGQWLARGPRRSRRGLPLLEKRVHMVKARPGPVRPGATSFERARATPDRITHWRAEPPPFRVKTRRHR